MSLPGRPLRVVLLEDEPLDAELVADALRDDGLDAEVKVVGSGETFRAAIATGAVDLVLADYSLPGYGGALALEDAKLAEIDAPFIFVSGTLGEEVATESLRRGATDFVLKQRLSRLGLVVRRALDEVEQRRQRRRAEAELRSTARKTALLADISDALASSVDAEAAIRVAAAMVVPTAATWCVVHLVDESGEWRVAAAHHHDRSREPALRAAACRATRIDDATWTDDLAPTPPLALALTTHGHSLGGLWLAGAQGDGESSGVDETLAAEIARRLVVALENASLLEVAKRERVRAEDANRAKDEFLAIVSHELRTPLNAILGWARLLRGGTLDDARKQRAMETIERNAIVQAQLIEDLLDVSRIITGKMHISVAPVQLGVVAQAAVDTLRPAADAKGVELELTVGSDIGPVVGDADRLQQVIWNLVSNAVKFTPSGGRVEVRVGATGDAAEIRVIDSGQGIDPAFLPMIFERFRQEDGSTTRTKGGLGLGLAIVKHLVELHGGEVDGESGGLGRGATLVVRLPLSTPNPSKPALSATPPRAGPARPRAELDLAGLRVLVVDDERDARDLLLSLLDQYRAQVRCASSVAEAFATFTSWRPEVVVSDVGMPGEDGHSLVQRIRALSPAEGGRTPAIALTAYTRIEDRTRALLAGFTLHLAKPIEPSVLLSAVATVANRSSNPP